MKFALGFDQGMKVWRKTGSSLIAALLTWIFIIIGNSPSALRVAAADVVAVCDALNVELLTDEVYYAVTKNLRLDPDEICRKLGADGATISWSSSDAETIREDGTVHRDKYRDKAVTLTAEVLDGAGIERKSFEFTVLSEQTEIYMAENFAYNAPAGTRVTEAEGIVVNPSSNSSNIGAEGWAFAKQARLSPSPLGAMDAVLASEGNAAEGHAVSCRRGGTEDLSQDYIRYAFGKRPSGNVIWEADVKTTNSSYPQVYLFEIYGAYANNGEKTRVRLADFSLRFAQGTSGPMGRFCAGYWEDGQQSSPKLETIPCQTLATDDWVRVKIAVDSDSQTWNAYVNGARVNVSPIPFYEKYKGGPDKGELLFLNDFQIGLFRGYVGGELLIDNVSVRRNTDSYSENAEAHEAADTISFDTIKGSNVSEDAVGGDLNLPAVSGVFDVTWSSSDESALTNRGEYVNTGENDVPVTLTANICRNGEIQAQKSFFLLLLAAEPYRKVNRIIDRLRFEHLSVEPQSAVTSHLDLSREALEKVCDLSGAKVVFSSSDKTVLSSEGVVSRQSADRGVRLEITVTDEDSGYVKTSLMDVVVLGTNKQVFYSSNFYEPMLLGSDLAQLELWDNTVENSGFMTTVACEDDNYLLKSYREAAGDDLNFARLTLGVDCRTAFDIAARVKLTQNAEDAVNAAGAVYVFEVYGEYETQTGSGRMSAKMAEARFGYDTGRIRLQHSENAQSVEIKALPELNTWFELRLSFDALSHSYDIYIDGKRVNEEKIPFYQEGKAGFDSEHFRGLRSFQYNSFRSREKLGMTVDDLSVTGKKAVHHSLSLYESGAAGEREVQSLDELNHLKGDRVDAVVELFNGLSEQRTMDVFLAAYRGGQLVSVQKSSETTTLDAGAAGSLNFENIDFGAETDGLTVKCFLWEKSEVKPLAESMEMNGRQTVAVVPKHYAGENGRDITYIDLNGDKAYKVYFNAQCWSADGSKLYFQAENHDIYEFNTATEEIRFISKCNTFYGFVAANDDSLIFTNADNRVIRMDTDTHEKEFIAALPAEAGGPASQLSVTNDAKKLAVIWPEDASNFPDTGLKYRRFPILDLETGEWDYFNHYFGFSDVPPYNTCINPQYGNLLLFNHANDANDERIWLIDTNSDESYNLYRQKPYNDLLSGESVSHECWTHDGERLVLAVNNIGSRQIGKNGVMSIDKEGGDRRYINSDYSYLHLGANPVSDRWVVGDTGYGNAMTSKIILVDCYSGRAYELATVRQTGLDSVAHCHPAFTPDGNAVYFGMYNEDYSSNGIGIIDVSDIVNGAPEREIINLSENCRTESVEGFDYTLAPITAQGRTGFQIAEGGYMNVNYVGTEKENASVELEIEYLSESAQELVLEYWQWVQGNEKNALNTITEKIQMETPGQWHKAVVEVSDMNLEGMGQLGADFSISAVQGEVIIGSVSLNINS